MLPPIQTAAEYEAAVVRFWDLIDPPIDLPLLLALRETMRAYEHPHNPAARVTQRVEASGTGEPAPIAGALT